MQERNKNLPSLSLNKINIKKTTFALFHWVPEVFSHLYVKLIRSHYGFDKAEDDNILDFVIHSTAIHSHFQTL